MKFKTKRIVADYRLHFSWEGGPYIDIGFRPGTAFDVINVWDSATDTPTIPRTRAAFLERVDEYINDPETDHAHDLENYALYA